MSSQCITALMINESNVKEKKNEEKNKVIIKTLNDYKDI